MTFMKAIIQESYGPPDQVLQLREVPKPVPGSGEVLVRVRAASVHPDIWHVVTGRPWILRLMGSGLRRPKQAIPGTDLAGTVESLGPGVSRFAVGDSVFGESHAGFQWLNGGAFAEYAAVPAESLVHMPEGLAYEAAASIPTSGIIALLNLGTGAAIKPGQAVLINGAAGGVGSIALQLAKAAGAVVTGVDMAGKLDLLRDMGADHVLDAGSEDFLRGGARYDLVFDVASNLTFARSRRILKPDGKYIVIGHDHYGRAAGPLLGSLPWMIGLTLLSLFDRRLPRQEFKSPPKRDMLEVLKGLLASGKLRARTGRTFPLAEVPQALRHLQDGKAVGKLIILP